MVNFFTFIVEKTKNLDLNYREDTYKLNIWRKKLSIANAGEAQKGIAREAVECSLWETFKKSLNKHQSETAQTDLILFCVGGNDFFYVLSDTETQEVVLIFQYKYTYKWC